MACALADYCLPAVRARFWTFSLSCCPVWLVRAGFLSSTRTGCSRASSDPCHRLHSSYSKDRSESPCIGGEDSTPCGFTLPFAVELVRSSFDRSRSQTSTCFIRTSSMGALGCSASASSECYSGRQNPWRRCCLCATRQVLVHCNLCLMSKFQIFFDHAHQAGRCLGSTYWFRTGCPGPSSL